MKRSKPNNKPKEMKIEFLWFLLALPAALNERNGAHAKRPKARGKPSQIQSNNAPSALFDGIGLGAVGVALFFCGLRAAGCRTAPQKRRQAKPK